jgi:hypothetical protein
MAFVWDDLAMLVGLSNHGHLNGRAVRVMATTPKNPLERAHVQLMTEPTTRVRVKPTNLRRIRAPDDLEAFDVKLAMPGADVVDCGMFLQVAQHSHKFPGCPGLSLVSVGERKDEERRNVDAVVEGLASAGFGLVAPAPSSPSPVGRRAGNALRMTPFTEVSGGGVTSTVFRSSPLRKMSYGFEDGVGAPLAEAEKAEALRIGRYGEVTTPMQWGDFCRAVKTARGGVYPSDWHHEIITGKLYRRNGVAEEDEQTYRSRSAAALADAVVVENGRDFETFLDAACEVRRNA